MHTFSASLYNSPSNFRPFPWKIENSEPIEEEFLDIRVRRPRIVEMLICDLCLREITQHYIILGLLVAINKQHSQNMQ